MNRKSLALKTKNLIYKNDQFVSLNDATGKKHKIALEQ